MKEKDSMTAESRKSDIRVVPDPEVPEKAVRRKFTAAFKLRILKEAATYAKKIGIQHPFLGEFLQKGYWETIIPPNFADSKTYKLMGYEYIADVEFQSRAGGLH